ncbi:MAG: SHOCT domain-containing protein [Runella sp.]
MKTVRTMAIFGIVWFLLSFLCIATMQQSAYYGTKSDIDALAGWGYLGVLYALAFAIVVASKVKASTPTGEQNRMAKLIELSELRRRGILSDDEFQIMKIDLLRP